MARSISGLRVGSDWTIDAATVHQLGDLQSIRDSTHSHSLPWPRNCLASALTLDRETVHISILRCVAFSASCYCCGNSSACRWGYNACWYSCPSTLSVLTRQSLQPLPC